MPKDKEFILLVEDNPDDVTLAQMALRKCRIPTELVVTWNGEEALDFLFGRGKYEDRDTARKPALILLDLKIPYVSGLEVLQQIRAEPRTRALPVVVLTSSAEEKDQAESYRLGANEFCLKPLDFSEFMRLIQRLRGYWEKSN